MVPAKLTDLLQECFGERPKKHDITIVTFFSRDVSVAISGLEHPGSHPLGRSALSTAKSSVVLQPIPTISTID